ncbi:YkoF-like protein [Protomyces lactucae-debilis]|uniref:YkoF-like protein n=1 Tax=Protomyces lactucae-debilis TaxID=2754530 RepID=A0A1Y2FKH8_PROLT|nr:YkoF-like protein [Protomyces lactucae-debilis]ORY83295.1 YkoF-like protein [Protomyces lactucae-debilis]
MHCVADFCVIPMSTPSASVSEYIAEAQRVLQKTGLKFQMHSYGTGLEGEWSEVMEAIGKVHERLHELGVPRCATDIRIGTRTDKHGTMEHKVKAVEDILAKDA